MGRGRALWGGSLHTGCPGTGKAGSRRDPGAGLSPPELGGGPESARKVGGGDPTRPERGGLTRGPRVWLEL